MLQICWCRETKEELEVQKKMVQRLAEDKRRLIIQLDRWLTEAGRGQTEAHHAAGSLITEAGGGQTEANHAAGSLIDRGWRRTNEGSSCSWIADRQRMADWSSDVKHQSSVFMLVSLYGLRDKWNQYLVRMPNKFVPVPRGVRAHTWDLLLIYNDGLLTWTGTKYKWREPICCFMYRWNRYL